MIQEKFSIQVHYEEIGLTQIIDEQSQSSIYALDSLVLRVLGDQIVVQLPAAGSTSNSSLQTSSEVTTKKYLYESSDLNKYALVVNNGRIEVWKLVKQK